MNNIVYIDSKGNLNLSRLRPNQRAFVLSNKLNTGIVGGMQSGKSTSGVIKSLVHQLRFPKVPMAYYLPTYGLIADMLIPKLEQIYSSVNIDYDINTKDSKFITPYGEIWMRSMKDPRRIVSYSVGYSIVDEVDIVHPNIQDDVMGRISTRNSFRKATQNAIDFVSTPEGFGYMYKHFEKRNNENKVLFKLSTLENKDNIGLGFIEGMRELYSETQLQAYLHGDFVNLTAGTVFNDYDRKGHHTDREVKDNDVLHIGMDFNITKMSAVIHVIEDKVIKAVAEITDAYDTNQLAELIKQRYPKHSIVVYPDASGNSRNTSGRTDIEVLRRFKFKIRVLKNNPFVKDRINETNRRFRESTYLINSNTCPQYADALTQLAYKNGAPDKASGLDHVVDAGTYCVWWNKKSKTFSATAN